MNALALPCSAEAQVARGAYRVAGDDMVRLIRTSVSGRELADRGFPDDVDLALEWDVSSCAPLLREGAYQAV